MPPKIQQQKLWSALETPTPFHLLFLQSSRRELSQNVPTLWVSDTFSWALLQASFLLLGRKAQHQGLKPLLLAQCPRQAASTSDSPHYSQLSFISILDKWPNSCFRISAGTKALDILSAIWQCLWPQTICCFFSACGAWPHSHPLNPFAVFFSCLQKGHRMKTKEKNPRWPNIKI